MAQHQPQDPPHLPEWLAQARRHGMLSRLPERLVAAVVHGGRRTTYAARTVVPGFEERPWAAIVLSGCMRVYLTSADGSQITVRYMRPGDSIGALDASRGSLARSLQALHDSEVLHLDATRVQELARTEPPVAYEMLVEVARALRLAHRAYSMRAFGSMKLRVANAILERAAACGVPTTGAVVAGTQHDLAAATGTVREVVASALQALKRDGIVEVRRGRVVIRDVDRLLREADGGLGFARND